MYFSRYRIIKCVSFELIHYVINLDDVSFSKIFNEFDFVFLSNILLVLNSIKLSLFSKQIKL